MFTTEIRLLQPDIISTTESAAIKEGSMLSYWVLLIGYLGEGSNFLKYTFQEKDGRISSFSSNEVANLFASITIV